MISAYAKETVLLFLFSGFLGFIAIVYILAEAILENSFHKRVNIPWPVTTGNMQVEQH